MLMKKALLIGLVLGLIAAWSVPAMAIDLTASGYIGAKGYIFSNTNGPPPFVAWGIPGVSSYAYNRNNSPELCFNDAKGSFINSRAELQFTVRASEDLFGVFKFRMNSSASPWGQVPGAATGNDYAVEGASIVAVNVQEIFVDFRVPPKLPLWVRVGLQPIFIRGWIFMFEEAPGVSVRLNVDPIKLGVTGYYAKLLDPSTISASGGAEFYAVDAKIPLSFGKSVNIAPGMFFAFQNNRVDNGAALDPDAQQLWWLGVNLDGKIGPINTQVDFIYNGGTLKNETVDNLDYASWLISGSLSYVFKKLEFGVGAKYVKGDNTSTDTIETFQLPGTYANYGSESMAISGDFIVFDHGWMQPGPGWPGAGLIDGPSTFWFGYWDVRAFAYYQVLDWLKVGAQLGYIGDTVSGDGTYGIQDAIGNDGQDDSGIGWEMDFGVNVDIYKNLSLQTGFGYLFAQKALSQAGGVAPNDPWALTSRLMYFF
jgi:hypothetical protein